MSSPTHLPSDTRLAKSYIWYGKQCFFVSTIDRESSAALAYGARYAETMIWIFDWDKNERGELIHQGEDSEGCIDLHMAVCSQLHRHGIRGIVKDEL